MGNADSFATGGLNSTIGPALMRKVAPLSTQIQDIAVLEVENYRDNTFSSVAGRLENISFQLMMSTPHEKLRTQLKKAFT